MRVNVGESEVTWGSLGSARIDSLVTLARQGAGGITARPRDVDYQIVDRRERGLESLWLRATDYTDHLARLLETRNEVPHFRISGGVRPKHVVRQRLDCIPIDDIDRIGVVRGRACFGVHRSVDDADRPSGPGRAAVFDPLRSVQELLTHHIIDTSEVGRGKLTFDEPTCLGYPRRATELGPLGGLVHCFLRRPA